MKITETVQLEFDFVKQKQKEKNWSQKLELDSVLLRLPYYDAIRMVLIDPMHNLFLGKENFKFFRP